MKQSIHPTAASLCSAILLTLLPLHGEEAAPADAKKPAPTLDATALTEARETYTMPTPGELLSAAQDTIDLKAIVSHLDADPKVNLDGSDAMLAHALGDMLADGFIALHAKDAKTTKSIGKKLLDVGKLLGADELVLAEGKKIGTMVDAEKWSDAATAADSFRVQLVKNLAKDGDVDLVTIIQASGWLRGFSLIADQVSTAYSGEASRFLRQHDLAAHLAARTAKLGEGRVKDAAKAAAALKEISELTNVAQDADIPKETIAKIAAATKSGITALEGLEAKK